jgi:hypothetical protein
MIKAIAPYIGDFKNEYMEFIPYSRWISEVLKGNKIYLSTHENRFFLYDFIKEECKIPVYKHLSREENEQVGYVHNKVEKQDYNLILRSYKEKIAEIENCSIREIETITFPYTKISNPIQYNKKIFKKTIIDIENEYSNKIVYIPSRNDKKYKIEQINKFLKSCYNDNMIVIGDMNSYLYNDNIFLNEFDYFSNGYKNIFSTIKKAKCVICPLSHWTIISNLQKVSVFSWGKNPGQYRKGEMYNFGNNNCTTIPTDDRTNVNVIVNGIKDFINKLK